MVVMVLIIVPIPPFLLTKGSLSPKTNNRILSSNLECPTERLLLVSIRQGKRHSAVPRIVHGVDVIACEVLHEAFFGGLGFGA